MHVTNERIKTFEKCSRISRFDYETKILIFGYSASNIMIDSIVYHKILTVCLLIKL